MFLKLYKKTGDFTNKKVREIGYKIGTKKVGHTGILDPLASGLIIIATDYDTKLLQYITDKNKEYIAKSLFNWSSDTLDIDGNKIQHQFSPVSQKDLVEAIIKVTSRTTQIPPKFSSKKINGVHAYDLARSGKEFELKPQNIVVHGWKLLNFDFEKQEYEIYFNVSEGTYIRTLLYDISVELNNTSVMTSLKRIGVGKIQLNSNLKPGDIEQISDLSLLFNLKSLKLTKDISIAIKDGKSFYIDLEDEELIFILNYDGEICCVGMIKNKYFYPKKVFIERLILN